MGLQIVENSLLDKAICVLCPLGLLIAVFCPQVHHIFSLLKAIAAFRVQLCFSISFTNLLTAFFQSGNRAKPPASSGALLRALRLCSVFLRADMFHRNGFSAQPEDRLRQLRPGTEVLVRRVVDAVFYMRSPAISQYFYLCIYW